MAQTVTDFRILSKYPSVTTGTIQEASKLWLERECGIMRDLFDTSYPGASDLKLRTYYSVLHPLKIGLKPRDRYWEEIDSVYSWELYEDVTCSNPTYYTSTASKLSNDVNGSKDYRQK